MKNIIDEWLEEHGTPEIHKQVEAEAEYLMKQETIEEVAVKLSEHLEAREQAMFVAGFIECSKWQNEQNQKELKELKNRIYDLIKFIESL